MTINTEEILKKLSDHWDSLRFAMPEDRGNAENKKFYESVQKAWEEQKKEGEFMSYFDGERALLLFAPPTQQKEILAKLKKDYLPLLSEHKEYKDKCNELLQDIEEVLAEETKKEHKPPAI
jgi:hypothetical protein